MEVDGGEGYEERERRMGRGRGSITKSIYFFTSTSRFLSRTERLVHISLTGRKGVVFARPAGSLLAVLDELPSFLP